MTFMSQFTLKCFSLVFVTISFVTISSLMYMLWVAFITYGYDANIGPKIISNIITGLKPNINEAFTPNNFNLSELPLLMSPDEIVSIAEHIIACSHLQKCKYLEWGSGGSTQLVSMLLDNSPLIHAYSIEHATHWCQKLRRDSIIKFAIAIGKLNYYCVDTGVRLRAYGRPANNDSTTLDKMIKYINWIDQINSTAHYDLILIDGRFRVACALKLILGHYINEKSVVLMHDYISMRREYSYVETYYTKVKQTKRLAVLKLKNNINYEDLTKDFHRFKHDAER